MKRPVKFRIKDGIAIVTLAQPPVNALSQQVREGLWEVFGRIADQSETRAVILIAEGEHFCAGTDVRDLDTPRLRPTPTEVFGRIEGCSVPVVAGLHGSVLGSGAELALACHYRLAAAGTIIGLPEVTLGLVPGGGGTQRLPRLVGAEAALNMILGGRPLDGEAARKIGLVDGLVDGHVPTGTFSYAEALVARGAGCRPTGTRRDGLADGAAFVAQVAARRRALSASRLFAPVRGADCVEAALLLPLDAGLAFEAAAFDDCLAHPQSRALRHIFVAERQISPALLPRGDGQRGPTAAAETVLHQLRGALGAAAAYLERSGTSRDGIDSAMLAFGFTHTPFGGGTPGASGAGVALVQRRLIAAMMAEGARLAGAGAVARASDIDALAVHGLGFPRWRGGPMMAAQIMGLLPLMREMEAWAADSPLWSVPRLLREAVKYADGFDALPVRGPGVPQPA